MDERREDERRQDDRVRHQAEDDPVRLTAAFIASVDGRLDKLAKQLRVRYIIFIVGFFVGGYIILGSVDKSRDASKQAKAAVLSTQRTNDQVARLQRANTQALCAFRNDLQQRADSTEVFLAKHPNGIPGIPAATLRVGLVNEQRTLKALRPLVC